MANYLEFPCKPQAVNVSLEDIITGLGFVYVATASDHLCKNHRVMYFDPKYPNGYYTRHWYLTDGKFFVEDQASEHYR